MTDREIMQQALDMIDKLTWALETHLYIKAPSDAKPLMDALRTALAQSDNQEPVAHLWECIGRWSSYLALNGEKANLAPPEWLVDAVKAATVQPEHRFDTPESHIVKWSIPVDPNNFGEPLAQPEPVAKFDDPQVQLVYEILCSDEAPPKGEHWEGFIARRIVDALAQPEQEPVKKALRLKPHECICGYSVGHPLVPKCICKPEYTAQPEQEHIECGYDETVGMCTNNPCCEQAQPEQEFKYTPYGLRSDENGKLSIGEISQREWVGLTVEEILSAAKEVPITCIRQRDYDLHFAPIIEAKLKEKNNGSV